MIGAWLGGDRARILAAPAAALLLLALVPAEGIAASALRALAVLGALALLAGVARRRPAAGRPLMLLDRQALGGGAGLALLEVEGRRLLVGHGPAGVALVAELNADRRPS